MSFGIKRSELRRLAEAKLTDAELLRHGRNVNAYYLAGYATSRHG